MADARVRGNPPKWLARTEFPIDPDLEAESLITLQPDALADASADHGPYFQFAGAGGDDFILDRISRTYLRGSAYYFERLMGRTSEAMATPADLQSAVSLWSAIRREIFGGEGQSSETERYQRWLAAGLEPLGLTEDGRIRSGGMNLLQAMLNRFISCYDKRLDQDFMTPAGADFEREYASIIRRMHRAGLINDPLSQRLLRQGSGCQGQTF